MEHEHPSFFELDELALAPEEVRQARLMGCTSCLQYTAEQRRELPIPEWAHAAGRRTPRRLLRWLSVTLVGAVAASVAVVVMRPSGMGDIREKGVPNVSLYIKHDGEVRRWDGIGPVSAGDALMLEIDSTGYRAVSVESLSSPSAEPLYQGEVKGAGRVLIPQSFRVDDSPGPERLRVRLTGDAGIWTKEISLPKRGAR
jgi:hypothetical protein